MKGDGSELNTSTRSTRKIGTTPQICVTLNSLSKCEGKNCKTSQGNLLPSVIAKEFSFDLFDAFRTDLLLVSGGGKNDAIEGNMHLPGLARDLELRSRVQGNWPRAGWKNQRDPKRMVLRWFHATRMCYFHLCVYNKYMYVYIYIYMQTSRYRNAFTLDMYAKTLYVIRGYPGFWLAPPSMKTVRKLCLPNYSHASSNPQSATWISVGYTAIQVRFLSCLVPGSSLERPRSVDMSTKTRHLCLCCPIPYLS